MKTSVRTVLPTLLLSFKVPTVHSFRFGQFPSSSQPSRRFSSQQQQQQQQQFHNFYNAPTRLYSSMKDDKDMILVVGSANQDLVSYTPIVPTLGETVMGTDFSTACGGKGANQAVAAASLRLAPVSMLCRVGTDLFGKNLLENFKTVGVEYFGDSVITSEAPSGVASIVVDESSGDNMIVVSPGANYKLTQDDVKSTIADSKPSQVLVQLEILPPVAYEALKAGKAAGACTILNTAPAPEGWSLDDPEMNFLEHVDILILNETELQKVAKGTEADDEETLAKSLLPKIGTAVIVTLGSRGAMVVEKSTGAATLVDAPEDLPARKLPVKNTVGAGDAFCGALAAYRSAGLSLTESSKLACGVASMSVRKDGAQTSYPLYEELPECLKVAGSTNSPPPKKTKTKPIITFVTGNKKKLEEAKQILAGAFEGKAPFELTNQKIDLPELQGDPIEIAKEKCKLAAQKVNGAVFTEDTSLCFNALNGLPGPYIKWFLDQCGHSGLNQMLDGFDDRTAYAQTIVAYTTGPGEKIYVFDGRTNGKIVAARGPTDFGWDPVFEPDEGEGKTYAEMTKEFKNSISHRGRSFEKFKAFLAKT